MSDERPSIDNVVELRPLPLYWDGLTCDRCGEAWFRARVAFAADRTVSAYAADPACIGCGWQPPVEGPVHG